MSREWDILTIMDTRKPFCFGSSSKQINTSLIQDHMVSHYQKVFSAKVAVDSAVPKSLLCSVKYCDQQRREELKTNLAQYKRRAQLFSQRSTKTNNRPPSSTENVQGRASLEGNETAYLYMGGSIISTPKITTSFPSKQIVYPLHANRRIGSSLKHYRSISDVSYSSPNSHLCFSDLVSRNLNRYKSFQDPTQKTYSGDLLQLHSRHFTGDKPFTPRTLKTDRKSFLSQYRYYTPPLSKQVQETTALFTRQEKYHEREHVKGDSLEEEWDLPLEFSNKCEWLNERSDHLNHSAFRHHRKTNRTNWTIGDQIHSSFRVSPEGVKSPTMIKVTEEEEEIMYLEFIADITNEILSRGLYSNRALKHVFDRHIGMNKHRLDEDKMQQLLEVLRNDLESPVDSLTPSAKPEERNYFILKKLQLSQGQESKSETKEQNSLFACTVFDMDPGEFEDAIPSSVSPQEPEENSLNSDVPGAGEHGAKNLEDMKIKIDCELSLRGNKQLTDLENNDDYSRENHQQSSTVEDLGNNFAESLFVY